MRHPRKEQALLHTPSDELVDKVSPGQGPVRQSALTLWAAVQETVLTPSSNSELAQFRLPSSNYLQITNLLEEDVKLVFVFLKLYTLFG